MFADTNSMRTRTGPQALEQETVEETCCQESLFDFDELFQGNNVVFCERGNVFRLTVGVRVHSGILVVVPHDELEGINQVGNIEKHNTRDYGAFRSLELMIVQDFPKVVHEPGSRSNLVYTDFHGLVRLEFRCHVFKVALNRHKRFFFAVASNDVFDCHVKRRNLLIKRGKQRLVLNSLFDAVYKVVHPL